MKHRPPRDKDQNSVWERYLTGQLSATDKDALPELIKQLHREIATMNRNSQPGPWDYRPIPDALPPKPRASTPDVTDINAFRQRANAPKKPSGRRR